eukprot:3306886-Rhodomonas_salina.3
MTCQVSIQPLAPKLLDLKPLDPTSSPESSNLRPTPTVHPDVRSQALQVAGFPATFTDTVHHISGSPKSSFLLSNPLSPQSNDFQQHFSTPRDHEKDLTAYLLVLNIKVLLVWRIALLSGFAPYATFMYKHYHREKQSELRPKAPHHASKSMGEIWGRPFVVCSVY